MILQPFSPDRVKDNLLSIKPELKKVIDEAGPSFEQTDLYKDFLKVFGNDPLVSEVKQLNMICVNQWGDKVFTVDRVEPYKIQSKHLGISRVLQSFEVVLLSLLTRACIIRGHLPLSLDHDGLLCLVKASHDPYEVCESLTQDLSEWSGFLLEGKSMFS